MLDVSFYNDKKRMLGSMFGEMEMPDGVSEIRINGKYGSTPSGFQTLLRILKRSNTTIKTVIIERVDDISPEYLAFLVWISHKTDALEFKRSKLGDTGFACLMSGILIPNGLKMLNLDFGIPVIGIPGPLITTHQATLLSEAVASSSALETLWIRANNFQDLNEMGRVMVRTLRGNRSLKRLALMIPKMTDCFIIHDLVTAALLQTKVKGLKISQHGDSFGIIRVDELADLICRPECSLETLELEGIQPIRVARAAEDITERNSSVKHLQLKDACVECLSTIMQIVPLFVSLKVLSVAENTISDLTPLDPLLLGGEKSNKLEVLVLDSNQITEDDFNVFVNKVPRMNSLRSLNVGENPALQSASCLTALKDAVWLNKSLERVHYFVVGQEENSQRKLIDSSIRLATALNRGAKRKLLDEYPLSLPQNLWPHVLKRAVTIKYYKQFDEWESPSLTSPRLDVVYWLLRRKMLC